MGSPARDQLSVVCSEESPDPRYRYSYTRRRHQGSGHATVILYNPVHRGDRTDPTTGRCMTWLCSDPAIGAVTFVNLFAYRHANPLALIALAKQGVDVVGPRNDEFTIRAIAQADLIVVAWGATPPRVDPKRANYVLSLIDRPYCFGLNMGGSPIHPNRRGNSAALRYQPYVGGG